MPSVWHEKRGRNYRVFWYVRSRREDLRSQLIGPELRDVVDFEEKKRREVRRLAAGLPPLKDAPPPLTVGQAADEYLTYSKKEKNFRTYRNFDLPVVTALRRSLGERTPLADVTPADVQRWKHGLPATTTAAIWFRQARAFFNYHVALRHVPESPAKGVKKPPEGEGGRALTDEELTKLMAAAPEPLYRCAVFSMNTMLRIGEVAIFDWRWTREVEVGPGGDRRRVLMGRVPWQLRKTRLKVKKDCVFPINDAARAVMGEPRPEGLVFPWAPSTIQHLMIGARTAAGLPEDLSFHSFRHTGATRYLENGHMEDLLDSRIWSDPRSLLRYVHVDPETLALRFSEMRFPRFSPRTSPQKPEPEAPSASGSGPDSPSPT